jgi:hypothetical protein
MSCLAHAFDVSMRAASRVGPNTGSPRAEPVDDAERERRLGPDEREVRALRLGERHERVDVGRATRDAAAERGDPGVARARRRSPRRRLAQLPGERVLAARRRR